MLTGCAGAGLIGSITIPLVILVIFAVVKMLVDAIRFSKTKKIVTVDREPSTQSGGGGTGAVIVLSVMVLILSALAIGLVLNSA